MPDTYKVFRAFVASPGDVAAERQLAEETIEHVNRALRDTIGVAIETRKWEHLPPIAPNLADERIQDILNREVERCQFFILILNKRYGTIEPGHDRSNTEREIDTILTSHEKRPEKKILAYFRELGQNADPGEQETKVRELRSRLEKLGLPYRTYREPAEFNQYLAHDLYDVILRIHLSPFKQQALKSFWRFGDAERHGPRLAIVYPPVERANVTAGAAPDYWLNRLASQMAFEDFKTIQKIERSLRLLRFGSYRIYPFTDVPPELPWMNRIWICLPRNKRGLKALREHADTRFELRETKDRPPAIRWRLDDGNFVDVLSPMAEYLRRQRSRMQIGGEWHHQLNRVITKDFAVLARMQRQSADEPEPLWDYFFAGIRGLGTWGASWFVDRQYKRLQRFDDSERVEILLQVTFRDGRILDVSDVSDQPADYFSREMSAEVIDENIRAYGE